MTKKLVLDANGKLLLNADKKPLLLGDLDFEIASSSSGVKSIGINIIDSYYAIYGVSTFTITSPGYFTNITGTANYGTSYTIGSQQFTLYYIVPSGETCTLTAKDGQVSLGVFSGESSGITSDFDVSNLPLEVGTFRLASSYTQYYGIMSNISTNLNYFYLGNAVNGVPVKCNLADVPSSWTYMVVYNDTGSTDYFYGNVGELAGFAVDIVIVDSGPLSYTSSTWTDNLNRLQLQPRASAGLTSTQVDNILIDIYNAFLNGNSDKADGLIINLTGSNASRTSASNTAVAFLKGWGATVTTN